MLKDPRAVRLLAAVAATALLAFYLAQFMNLAPNHTDGGVLLHFIHAYANDALPHHDLVDAYGPFNWVAPVLFYELAGQKVIGVRAWMLILKILTVWGSYLLVSKLASRLYGVLAAVWVTVLLGQPWQSLQTAYAFLNVMPWVLGAWYFLLCRPLARRETNLAVAALFTTLAIWTKLNTGGFLLAAGIFYCAYWLPTRSDGSKERPALRTAFLVAQLLGLAAYAVVFHLYVRRFYSVWYFAYLTFPLLLAVGMAGLDSIRDRKTVSARERLSAAATYSGGCLALSAAILLGYYGLDGGQQYVRELGGIVSTITYRFPFPPLGEGGFYKGLNEFYWLQMPWLAWGLFAVWCGVAWRRGRRIFGEEWNVRRAQMAGLLVLSASHAFVIYSRADETHIFQTLPFVAIVVFVVLHQLERLLVSSEGRQRPRWVWRGVLTAGALTYASTIAIEPNLDRLRWRQGDWQSDRLAFLDYRPVYSPYVWPYSPEITDTDWDKAADYAARYIDGATDDGEEILIVTANRLLGYNSNTKPIGGRYFFFFYLVSVGLMDREAFDAAVPKSVMNDILQRPPRVIVGTFGYVPLEDQFPEFQWLRDRWYVRTATFRHIFVYELSIRGQSKKFRQ